METNIEIIKQKIKEAGGSDRGSLADVLLAVGNHNGRSTLKINDLGGFSWFIDGEWKDIALPRYDLLKDDLRDQSDETISFIYSLLK